MIYVITLNFGYFMIFKFLFDKIGILPHLILNISLLLNLIPE